MSSWAKSKMKCNTLSDKIIYQRALHYAFIISRTYKIYRSLYGDLRIRQIDSSKGYLPGAVSKINSTIKITHECIYQWVHSKRNEHLLVLLPRAKKKHNLSCKNQQIKEEKITTKKYLDVLMMIKIMWKLFCLLINY